MVAGARASRHPHAFLHPGGLQWLLRRLANESFTVRLWRDGAAPAAAIVDDAGNVMLVSADPSLERYLWLLDRAEAGRRERSDGAIEISVWDGDHELLSAIASRGYAPSGTETSWVDPLFADPWVDHTARYVFDYHYDGAGNWPFNTAYAAERGLVSDVTQLRNLREAEPFIKAGIPLVASIAFTSNKLDGAIKSTNGHLVVIEGFTGDGSKVIVDDPASATDADVKHSYDREQFERAWIPASGGIVYVDRPPGWPTPPLQQP